LDDIEIGSWLRLDQGPVTLASKTFAMPDGRINRQLFQSSAGKEARIGRAIESEAGTFDASPPRWTRLSADSEPVDPYHLGELFHRGSFKIAQQVSRSASDSRLVFDAAAAWRRGGNHPVILLDAMVHGIPHWQPSLWFGEATKNMAFLPYRLESFRLYAPLPRDGEVEVLTRAAGMPTTRTARIEVQVIQADTVVLDFALIEALFPIGFHDSIDPAGFKSFARDRVFTEGWSVARTDDQGTVLTREAFRQANWLPGTIEALYGLPADGSFDERQMVEQVAIKDHFASRYRMHPSEVRIEDGTVLTGPNAPIQVTSLATCWPDANTFRLCRTPT
jgi:hypothetical protein